MDTADQEPPQSPDNADDEPREGTFEWLIAQGVVLPARSPRRTLPEPVQANGTVSDLVAEQRR